MVNVGIGNTIHGAYGLAVRAELQDQGEACEFWGKKGSGQRFAPSL